MSLFQIAGVLGALTVSVSAHGHVSGVVSNGQWYAGTTPEWTYQAEKPNTAGWYANNQDNGYVDPTVFADGDIVCHKGATPGLASIPVTAGESIDIQWNTWPDSHHGPVLDYLAPVDGDFADIDKTALQFFKIDEDGLKDGSTTPGSWASDDLIANNNTWSVTIPASIAPGKYVLRHEIISLHSANNANGAQNYPQCLNIEVTSDGTDVPAGEPATSFYTAEDAGILINIYNAPLDYTFPGPALYSGAGSSPSDDSSSGSPAATTTATAPYANSTYSATATLTSSSIEVAPTTIIDPVQTTSAPTPTTEPYTPPTYETTTSAAYAPVATESPSEYSSKPEKDLPEGFGLADLQEWVAYLLNQGWTTSRNHARNFYA
ncbi:related to endoglucanase IV precursor [Ramularia collo-cygni]|uniref:Related to endoglucanase IV n=1 Tax=Ramularia collo-cygni TaxID=112498 RepID=A0A2D3V141_9PEZI|nr:related to endoglucanase IV precursor [Ramularia collo-cygni]CZT15219.1 related to endoglucanase IV precursor [Ramularia collo-cygni]